MRQDIPIGDLNLVSPRIWDNWLLLTAGRMAPGGFNAMTVSWGAAGVMWDKPVMLVVVRPSRHTYGFMEQGDSFTVCAFPPEYHGALGLLGTKSGRDGDKIREAGLTPVPAAKIEAPAYAEAALVVECRKIYRDDLHPAHFLADYIEPCYGGGDYHRLYIGEIVAAQGTPEYRRSNG